MNRLIDPPDRFSGTLDEWRAFLASMRAIKDPDDQVRDAIADAEAVIAAWEQTRPTG